MTPTKSTPTFHHFSTPTQAAEFEKGELDSSARLPGPGPSAVLWRRGRRMTLSSLPHVIQAEHGTRRPLLVVWRRGRRVTAPSRPRTITSLAVFGPGPSQTSAQDQKKREMRTCGHTYHPLNPGPLQSWRYQHPAAASEKLTDSARCAHADLARACMHAHMHVNLRQGSTGTLSLSASRSFRARTIAGIGPGPIRVSRTLSLSESLSLRESLPDSLSPFRRRRLHLP